jgi:hypothetical protein
VRDLLEGSCEKRTPCLSAAEFMVVEVDFNPSTSGLRSVGSANPGPPEATAKRVNKYSACILERMRQNGLELAGNL